MLRCFPRPEQVRITGTCAFNWIQLAAFPYGSYCCCPTADELERYLEHCFQRALLRRPGISGPMPLSREYNENDTLRSSYQNSLPNYSVSPSFHLACTKRISLFFCGFGVRFFVVVGFGWCVSVFVSLSFHQEIHSNVVKDDLCTMHTWRLHPCKN